MANRVDLSALRLEAEAHALYEPEEGSDAEDDEDYLDEDMERWNRILTILMCKVIDPSGKAVGKLKVWAIGTGEFEYTEDFLSFMDEWSRESHGLSCLFDRTAKLRSRFAREGTGVWGADVTDYPEVEIAYIEHMRIEPELRNQGVGAWAIQQLFRREGGRLLETDFLFVQPGALEEEFPRHDPWAPDPHRQAKLAMADRITRFYQRSGFRRVGTTSYFCLAHDPNHDSRHVPIEDDAKFVADVAMSQGELRSMLAR